MAKVEQREIVWKYSAASSRPGTTLALSEVLAIAARMRSVEQCWLLKAEWDIYSDGLCRTCDPMLPAHRTVSAECRTPFREPLQFIVIAVMSVMSGTFPDTYGILYMTVNSWCIWGPFYHRHVYRH
jgi:hypothetical protein